MSPISSKRRLPPFARLKSPLCRRALLAPVKAPPHSAGQFAFQQRVSETRAVIPSLKAAWPVAGGVQSVCDKAFHAGAVSPWI